MSMKFWPILYCKLLYELGQDFLDTSKSSSIILDLFFSSKLKVQKQLASKSMLIGFYPGSDLREITDPYPDPNLSLPDQNNLLLFSFDIKVNIIDTVCPGSSDPPEKNILTYSHQKFSFSPVFNYYDILG